MDTEDREHLKQQYANIREKHGKRVANEWMKIELFRTFGVEQRIGGLIDFYAQEQWFPTDPNNKAQTFSYGSFRGRDGTEMWEFYTNAEAHRQTCARMAEEFAASQVNHIETDAPEGAAIH
ncbi:hypothetical protein PFF91_06285 [Burkholderia cenocepacia]|uniref:hypothetical protein n=1 Tax=Burkholderia cenocepacia TaxID=95486 RepID=UPI001B95D7B0|nr:hypothetical protein [Burkholderia cenocepacia]MBR8096718.1 hypothetical protein [Burkholderia cenocepacia]MDA3665589.1 hypothetical protein [Burkholderia cenocepacia]MDA3678015.1 hypothetical protein [Burkholderia cenocepacia]MDA3682649.1 hypothetical protein [Burkholderia cenocepacia]MDA3690594.1 hypothetical protein [Burkholderia cenocepacia]